MDCQHQTAPTESGEDIVIIDAHTIYRFQCPNCGVRSTCYNMPSIDSLRKMGHFTDCHKCGSRVSIIGENRTDSDGNVIMEEHEPPRIVTCPKCGSEWTVYGFKPGETVTCTKCLAKITLPAEES